MFCGTISSYELLPARMHTLSADLQRFWVDAGGRCQVLTRAIPGAGRAAACAAALHGAASEDLHGTALQDSNSSKGKEGHEDGQ